MVAGMTGEPVCVGRVGARFRDRHGRMDLESRVTFEQAIAAWCSAHIVLALIVLARRIFRQVGGV